MSKFFDGLEKYIYWTSIPKIGLNDIVDILIVSVMIYLIVKWIKTTRAWVLLKGIIILLCIAFRHIYCNYIQFHGFFPIQ